MSFFYIIFCLYALLHETTSQQISPTTPPENNLILLSSTARGKCLDGSPSGFYFLPGSGIGANKFYIYLEGGGSCFQENLSSSIESCYLRSQSGLGSSKQWSKFYTNSGTFNESPELNPLFFDWNKVYVKYCDGSMYQGSSNPYQYKDAILYFRGSDTLKEIIQYLILNQNLRTASQVVFSGGDVGGQAVIAWNQFLTNTLQFSNIFIVPDSVFYPIVNVFGQNNEFARFVDLITSNQRGLIQPSNCPYLISEKDIQKCFIPVYILDLIVSPAFFIQSLIDSYSLMNNLQIRCVQQNSLIKCSQQEIQKVNQLTIEMSKFLMQAVAQKPQWGVWAISCIFHVFSTINTAFHNPNFSVPQNAGLTVSDALKQFILQQPRANGNHIHIDQVLYPGNTACS